MLISLHNKKIPFFQRGQWRGRILKTHLCFHLGPAVLPCDCSIEDHVLRCAVFGVHAVVSISYELDIITNLGFLSFFFDDSIIEDYQRVWVDVIKIVAGCLTRDFSLEELVILSDFCLKVILCTYPVACSLDLSSVRSFATSAFFIVCAVYGDDVAVAILIN